MKNLGSINISASSEGSPALRCNLFLFLPALPSETKKGFSLQSGLEFRTVLLFNKKNNGQL